MLLQSSKFKLPKSSISVIVLFFLPFFHPNQNLGNLLTMTSLYRFSCFQNLEGATASNCIEETDLRVSLIRDQGQEYAQADVYYSCGSCGYSLNLRSSTQATSCIGSEYRKSIKKGFISFLSIDLSRFTQVDKVNCLPLSFGLHRERRKLLCRKCGVLIGYVLGDLRPPCGLESPVHSISSYKGIMIRTQAVQPSLEC